MPMRHMETRRKQVEEMPGPQLGRRSLSTRRKAREGEEAADAPAMQVIVLGSGGGPLENNVTALLVRPVDAGWAKGSVVAVDAGVHLSAITRIFEQTQPAGLGTTIDLPHTLESGPFAGLEIASASPSDNAGYFSRNLVETYLITHPHLDHIAAFVINTSSLLGARPKRVAGLPSTIEAIKQNIFNNSIWPNLSDENNGAGLITYMRLVEGGSPALGEGEGKGYLEIGDGLSVKVFGVSHGHCLENHPHRGSSSSSRFGSFDAPFGTSSRAHAHGSASLSMPPSLRNSVASQDNMSTCVVDSSAYFIRDNATSREVLIFGDVEPDSISLSPRNHGVWLEAAPRIANGNLKAIFIECSYDNSQTDDRLFGHLTPRYVIQEMKALAAAVEMVRHSPSKQDAAKKRKRLAEEVDRRADGWNHGLDDRPISPKTTRPVKKRLSPAPVTENGGIETPHIATPTAEMSLGEYEVKTARVLQRPQSRNALEGLKVIIIHVKEKLVGGETARGTILSQLQEGEEEAQLGCEFIVSSQGQSFYL